MAAVYEPVRFSTTTFDDLCAKHRVGFSSQAWWIQQVSFVSSYAHRTLLLHTFTTGPWTRSNSLMHLLAFRLLCFRPIFSQLSLFRLLMYAPCYPEAIRIVPWMIEKCH